MKAPADTIWVPSRTPPLLGDSVRRRFPFPFPFPFPFAPPEGEAARLRLALGRRMRPTWDGGEGHGTSMVVSATESAAV